jgi:hypothetical protein
MAPGVAMHEPRFWQGLEAQALGVFVVVAAVVVAAAVVPAVVAAVVVAAVVVAAAVVAAAVAAAAVSPAVVAGVIVVAAVVVVILSADAVDLPTLWSPLGNLQCSPMQIVWFANANSQWLPTQIVPFSVADSQWLPTHIVSIAVPSSMGNSAVFPWLRDRTPKTRQKRTNQKPRLILRRSRVTNEDRNLSRVTYVGLRRGVSKGVEDGHRWVTPDTAVRPFQGWPTPTA